MSREPQKVPIAAWKPAPCGIPTDQERLEMVLRLLARETTTAVAIYAHGTAAYRSTGCLLSVDTLMRQYDVPKDGAGTPLGDIWPTALDDGSAFYSWGCIGSERGGVISVLTAAELEPHKAGPDVLLGAGLWARGRRSLDAKMLKRVAYWSRP